MKTKTIPVHYTIVVEPDPELEKLKAEHARIEAETAKTMGTVDDNPLLHLGMSRHRLMDAARDVIKYHDRDGTLEGELAAALEECDAVDVAMDCLIAESKADDARRAAR
jgi:hypothetical protein